MFSFHSLADERALLKLFLGGVNGKATRKSSNMLQMDKPHNMLHVNFHFHSFDEICQERQHNIHQEFSLHYFFALLHEYTRKIQRDDSRKIGTQKHTVREKEEEDRKK